MTSDNAAVVSDRAVPTAPDGADLPVGLDDGDGAAVLCTDLVRVYTAEGVEVQALQGLSLRVEPRELVAIVGASGSGKSTLLSILSGIDQPTAGTARVAGHQLVGMNRRQRVVYQRDAVGFVWQQTARNLLPYLTAAENIAIVLAVAGRGRGGAAGRRARVSELLELTGAADEADRTPAEMSGGQQQRVAIAVALANNPEVLLADEPTGELDEQATVRVLDTLRSVNDELGTTTLIVTHDAGVSDHVSRTVQIRDGRIAAETLRRTVTGPDGGPRQVAEDFAVLDRVGRMQLPPDVVRELGLRQRVRLHRQDDHLAVWPSGLDPTASGPDQWTDEGTQQR
ncbi:ABC transporter ATP-binding protein [Nakamurella lactea]|uniref:ABC transporter ATP-binding protein n=1 Tax=Nakamurella lactea TaxID=459515 RepID=UPI0004082861|nr:ABC transporter ATP-binding protein [Nakamurella lactea]